ncbi:MAG: Sec-independent protein translocase subunit TatA [Microbacteriaceae bacterium]|nr:Sec-independent protein translocase subunit TatA [Microbacteriaceae bacterium]
MLGNFATPLFVGNLGGWHFLIILLVVLLLFGATKLPLLAKSMGQSMKIFKKEINELHEDDQPKTKPGTNQTKTSSAANTAKPETDNISPSV